MSSTMQLAADKVTIRHYQPGDEGDIVELLNLCYGEWGTVHKWQGRYPQYPNFDKDDVFIMEDKDKIIGHRGLHFRDLTTGHGHGIPTVSLGDTAVDPHYRGRGLYAGLHEATLQAAQSKQASLALTWNLKGSITYQHNKRTGFVEIKQTPAYMKIINPGKVLKAGVSDFLHKNPRMSHTLGNMKADICFSINESEFSAIELLEETGQQLRAKNGEIKLIFSEDALSRLTNFRTTNRAQRARSLVSLVLHRKVKIKFSSPRDFWELACKGVKILGSL